MFEFRRVVLDQTLSWHSTKNEHLLLGVRMKGAIVEILGTPKIIQRHSRSSNDTMTVVFDKTFSYKSRSEIKKGVTSLVLPSSSCWLLARRFNGLVVRKKCLAIELRSKVTVFHSREAYLDRHKYFDHNEDRRSWYSCLGQVRTL